MTWSCAKQTDDGNIGEAKRQEIRRACRACCQDSPRLSYQRSKDTQAARDQA